MSRLRIIFITLLSLLLCSVASAQGTCATRGEFAPAALRYESKSGEATLFGFNEFTSPSSPPKKYWKKELSGSLVECVYSTRNLSCGAAGEPSIEWTGSYSWTGITFDCTVRAHNLRFENGRWRLDYYIRQKSQGQSNAYNSQTGATTSLYLVGFGSGADSGTTISTGAIIYGYGKAVPEDSINSGTFTLPQSYSEATPVVVTAQANIGDYKPAKYLVSAVSTKRTYAGECYYDSTHSGAPVMAGIEITTSTTGSCSGGDGAGTTIDTCTAVTAAAGLTTTIDRTVKSQSPTGECLLGPGGYDKKISACDRKETLTDEDTEDEAQARATVNNGTSSIAFRELRSTTDSDLDPFTFNFSSSTAFATFKTCPGSYLVTYHYARRSLTDPNAPWEDLGPLHDLIETNESEFVVSKEIPAPSPGYAYTFKEIVAAPISSCSNAIGGSCFNYLASVHSQLSLGRIDAARSAGLLLIDRNQIDATAYTPAALEYVGPSDPSISVLRDSNSTLRQVKAPTLLADIVSLVSPAEGFEVRFYHADQVGAPDPVTGLFDPSGVPFVTHRYDNPDESPSAGASRLRITEIRPASTKIFLYTHDTAGDLWSLAEGDGLRVVEETRGTEPNGDITKTRTLKTAAGQAASVIATTTRAFAWGEEKVGEVRDPAGAALTTTWTYYTDQSADGPNYRHLKQRLDPNGYWEIYTYDAQGRVVSTTAPHLNAAPGAPASLCRITAANHSPLPDADGDGQDEPMTLTTETLLGYEVSRSYEIEWTAPVTLSGDLCKRVTTVRCVVPGAAWNAPANLVTETLRHADGPFRGRMRRELFPAGTAAFSSYALDSATGNLTTTTASGVPSPAFDAVIEGERHVSVTSIHGHVIAEDHYYIHAANLDPGTFVSGSSATDFDSLGRPTRVDHTDGTYETHLYACCGLAEERDREGMVTAHTYDALGRRETSTRAGVTNKTVYDAADRVRATLRYPADTPPAQIPAVAITLAETDFDLTGRVTASRDAVGRQTGVTETYVPATRQTSIVSTLPFDPAWPVTDRGVVTELRASDGKLLSRTGNATAPVRYEYDTAPLPDAALWGLASGQHLVRVTETKLDDAGADTAETTATYTDALGRVLLIVRAGSPSASTRSFYNDNGQLDRQTDPDGVQTLFVYDAHGDLSLTVLDMNRDRVIDYEGGDRITRTTREVTARVEGAVTIPVQRVKTELWLTDTQDTPQEVSVSDTSLDGLTVWQKVNGLTTRSVTVNDAATRTRTETTTYPDETSSVRVFVDGRLESETRRDNASAAVTSASYDYDAHGRLETVTDSLGRVTTTTYYDDDQVHTVTTPDPDTSRSGSGYDAQTTTYTYDAAGRVWKIEQHDGALTETTYWPNGQVKRVSGGRTYPQAYTYDAQGRLKTLTTWQDFAGSTGEAVTTWSYHPERGWLENKRYNDNKGPDYTYTAAGRLETRTWVRPASAGSTAPLVTTYGYNNAGELDSITYTDATPPVAHTYDRAGRLSTTTDAAGLLTRDYDPASLRLSGETYTGAGHLSGRSLSRGYDSLHRAETLSTGGGYGLTYGYDAAGRLETVTQGAHSAVLGYEAGTSRYDRTTIKRVGVERLRHERQFDGIGRIGWVTATAGVSPVFDRDYRYHDANQRTELQLEDGRRWAYGYDALGQVTSAQKRLADNTTPLPGYTFGYTFDDIGNRTQTVTNGRAATYAPDLLNRYSSRQIPGAFDVRGEAFADATVMVDGLATIRTDKDFYRELSVANDSAPVSRDIVVEATRGSPTQTVSETRPAFLEQSPESFVHDDDGNVSQDDDGNLKQDGRWNYTWDAENRLVRIETRASVALAAPALKKRLTFVYDSQGRRIRKTVETWDTSLNSGAGGWATALDRLFVYDGWNLLAEQDAANGNALVRAYVWGLDLSSTLQDAGGVGGLLWTSTPAHTFAACSDANGNVVAWINTGTLAVAGRADYAPFGEVVQATGVAKAISFGFSSKYSDSETGFAYYGFRYYNPSTGRWLSRDPIGESGGSNLYGMVNNDPVNSWDYLGLIDCSAEKSRYESQKKAVDNLKKKIENLKAALERGVRNILNNGKMGRPPLPMDHQDGMSNADSVPGHVDELAKYAEALAQNQKQLEQQQKWLDAAQKSYTDCLERLRKECKEKSDFYSNMADAAGVGENIATGVAVGGIGIGGGGLIIIGGGALIGGGVLVGGGAALAY